MDASVVGASGFTGGELLRLLDGHPEFEVVQATSRSEQSRTVGSVHPNLRGMGLRFSDPADLESVDALFACTPHGVSMERIDDFRAAAETVVDLSADFRQGVLGFGEQCRPVVAGVVLVVGRLLVQPEVRAQVDDGLGGGP